MQKHGVFYRRRFWILFGGNKKMNDMITSIVTQLVYATITFAMGYSWNKSRSLAAIQKNTEKGIGLLLRSELHNYHEKGKARGFLTVFVY